MHPPAQEGFAHPLPQKREDAAKPQRAPPARWTEVKRSVVAVGKEAQAGDVGGGWG